MDWKFPNNETPIAYKTGGWDGKMSDEVVAEDSEGRKYIAKVYEGFMDGEEFKDWCDFNDNIINDVVRWLPIPD